MLEEFLWSMRREASFRRDFPFRRRRICVGSRKNRTREKVKTENINGGKMRLTRIEAFRAFHLRELSVNCEYMKKFYTFSWARSWAFWMLSLLEYVFVLDVLRFYTPTFAQHSFNIREGEKYPQWKERKKKSRLFSFLFLWLFFFLRTENIISFSRKCSSSLYELAFILNPDRQGIPKDVVWGNSWCEYIVVI